MEYRSEEYFLAFARDLVLHCGRKALKGFRNSGGWLKADRSLVTPFDIEIQETLQNTILDKFPDHGFLGEEMESPVASSGEESYFWIADPIDGTEAYASGLSTWGISLALFKRGKPLVGVFYQPVTRELYHATEKSMAMVTLDPGGLDEDNATIHVNSQPEFDHRTLCLVPSNFHRFFTSDFGGKQRSLGSTGAHICLVARGTAPACFFNARIWDIAAAALILKEAGGRILEWESGREIVLEDHLDGSPILNAMAVSSDFAYESVKSLFHSRN